MNSKASFREGRFPLFTIGVRKRANSMQMVNSKQMTIVADDGSDSSVTEMVKLPVKPENLDRMMDYVLDWHEMVIPTLPGFQKAALLSSAAGAVFVYAKWSSKEAIENANHDPRMQRYFKGLFPLLAGQPEIHICSVGMVAEAEA